MLDSSCTVVGIINCTPDSFSGDGVFSSPSSLVENALRKADTFISHGCLALDIGGESTRPGASPLSPDEEISRTLPVIDAIHKNFPHVSLSIDTSKASVALKAIEKGALIVNDVSALAADPLMATTISQQQQRGRTLQLVLMHNKTQKDNIITNSLLGNSYAATKTSTSLIPTLISDLNASIKIATHAGIKRDSLIIDPGIGFGKSIDDNMTILAHIPTLIHAFQLPLYIGASRKSFIGNILNKTTDQRLSGSLAIASIAAFTGARFIRVHDVEETLDAVKIAQVLQRITLRKDNAQDLHTTHDPA